MTETDFFYSYFYDHVAIAFTDSEELNEMAKYYLEKCCNVLENTAIIRTPAAYGLPGNKVTVPVFFENDRGDLLYTKKLEYSLTKDGKTDAIKETELYIQELLPLFKHEVEVVTI